MTQRFRIDGNDYYVSELTNEGKKLLEHMIFTQVRTQELANKQALLIKAKNAYIADLKEEITQSQKFVDIGALFNEE